MEFTWRINFNLQIRVTKTCLIKRNKLQQVALSSLCIETDSSTSRSRMKLIRYVCVGGKGAWHSENMQIHLVHSAPISNESSGKNNIKQSEVFLKQKQKINRDRERERRGRGMWQDYGWGKRKGSTASYATARQFNQDDMARSIAVLDSAILALIHKVLAPRTCPKMKNNNCAAPSRAERATVAREELRKIYQCKSLHCQPNGNSRRSGRKRVSKEEVRERKQATM